MAGRHTSSPLLAGDETNRFSGADSASTCASSDAGSEAREDEALEANAEANVDTQEASGSEDEREHEEAVDRELLVSALGHVLEHLSALGCRPQRASGFHAVGPPTISIPKYVQRITQGYHCSDQCLVLGLVYIDRIVNFNAEFVVSPLSVHRLVGVAVMVAAKFWDDVFYSNNHYAKIAGIKLTELNALEALFLKLARWRLLVEPQDYRVYYSQLLLAVRRSSQPASISNVPSSGVPRVANPSHAPATSSEPWPP